MTRTQVPAHLVAEGDVVDDARWPHVFRVGYVAIGRKWVTLRAFHPQVRVYPNPPRRVLRGQLVTITDHRP